MSVEEAILQKVRALPPEKREEVLKFAVSLSTHPQPRRPFRDPAGILADLNFELTEEDLAEARREMWANFPRE